MVEISTNSEGAELFHKVCQKEASTSRDGYGDAVSHGYSRIDMVYSYAKYTWDRYHSLHTYGKVIPFLSNHEK